MSEDDRSWHSQHRQARKAPAEEGVSPVVSIVMMVVGTVIMVMVSVLIVASMVK